MPASMMTVLVLRIPYEGDAVIGVYPSHDDAVDAANRLGDPGCGSYAAIQVQVGAIPTCASAMFSAGRPL